MSSFTRSFLAGRFAVVHLSDQLYLCLSSLSLSVCVLQMQEVKATQPLYWDNTYVYEGTAIIVSLTAAPAPAAPAPAQPKADAKPAAKPQAAAPADAKSKPSKGGKSQQNSAKDSKAAAPKDKASDAKAHAKPAPTTEAAVPKAANTEPRFQLVLDATIFHPQGGGQPSDVGVIALAETDGKSAASFVVESVSKDEKGVITHTGYFSPAASVAPSEWKSGARVSLKVDAVTRQNHARLHSAGHLIDIGRLLISFLVDCCAVQGVHFCCTCCAAVASLGLGLGAGKGNHAPLSSYVEYSGALSDTDRDALATRIQQKVDAMIAANYPVTTRMVEYSQIEQCCGATPAYLAQNKPARIVTIVAPRDCSTTAAATTNTTTAAAAAADKPMAYGCPCGGTHVQSLRALTSLQIRKLEKKGKAWRVKYSFSNDTPVL
jgi:alanyl-tRNA synthetase